MIFWTIVQLALRSLWANKLRSSLAMLGIIIGVWSVICALALGNGAQKMIHDQLTSLGSNVVFIIPGLRGKGGVMSGSQENLKIPDAEAMLNISEVARVAPVVRGIVQAKRANKNSHPSLLGTSTSYFAIREFKVVSGRILSDGDCDANSRVAVIGPATAKDLFGDDYTSCVDQMIEVKGVHYRVIGLLKAKGDQGWFNPDDQIIIPYTTAMTQVLGVDHLAEVDMSARDENQLVLVQKKVTRLLRKRHRIAEDADNDFNVHNMTEMLNTTANVTLIMTLLLAGIAGISLFVGGIGVMNVMLVTVAERTREIGTRKAIGAKRGDILLQFLIEACVMSGTGGLFGVVLGVGTALLVSWAQDYIPLRPTPLAALLATAFSAGVGIFFGYYPARRAARLDPIEALRYE